MAASLSGWGCTPHGLIELESISFITDLPSMTLTTSDLAGLMDAMLDDRHKPPQAPVGAAPPR